MEVGREVVRKEVANHNTGLLEDLGFYGTPREVSGGVGNRKGT